MPVRSAAAAGTASPTTRAPWARLSLAGLAAVAIQGYHLGADDAAIYVPGIKQAADPRLYPFGAEFFQHHARLTLLPQMVGGAARLSHVPVDVAIFASHLAGMLLLMWAAWKLLCACFETSAARWGGIALLAGTLSVPVAGTALAIADPYVTSRTFSTPFTMLAIACWVTGERKMAVMWWILTALVHPQMSVYCAVFLVCLTMAEWWTSRSALTGAVQTAEPVYLAAGVFLFTLTPGSEAARRALLSRTFFLVSQWAWYEWLGVIAPVALLWWFATVKPRGTTPTFQLLARSLPPFAMIFTLAGIVLLRPRLENLTRIQPMRTLHLLYVIFFLMLGGLFGEYVLRRRVWRWLTLFVPLAVSMWLLQQSTYPSSPHLELGTSSNNAWTSAFFWIRAHTPKNAVFALDPYYMSAPGEDMHGFRAVAERSMLADAVKDSGAVSLFPSLAEDWDQQVQTMKGWRSFELADWEKLEKFYPVTWLVASNPAPHGLDCPYQNQTVSVCHLPESSRISSNENRSGGGLLRVRAIVHKDWRR